MISLVVVIWLLFAHWVADFIFQTDYWAKNKSTSNVVLGLHVLVYSLMMGVAVLCVTSGLYTALLFTVITFVCHFCTDYVTSRITSSLAKVENWHDFFIVVGLDQLLHIVQILLTFYLLVAK